MLIPFVGFLGAATIALSFVVATPASADDGIGTGAWSSVSSLSEGAGALLAVGTRQARRLQMRRDQSARQLQLPSRPAPRYRSNLRLDRPMLERGQGLASAASQRCRIFPRPSPVALITTFTAWALQPVWGPIGSRRARCGFRTRSLGPAPSQQRRRRSRCRRLRRYWPGRRRTSCCFPPPTLRSVRRQTTTRWLIFLPGCGWAPAHSRLVRGLSRCRESR